MRIAILSYEYPPETGFGGIGTYSYYQARALAKLGHDVHVFAGSTREGLFRTECEGVKITRIKRQGWIDRMLEGARRSRAFWFQNRIATAFRSYEALLKEIRDGEFDFVEAPECGADSLVVATLLPVPVAVKFHSPARLIMNVYDTSRMDRELTAFVEQAAINQAAVRTSCSKFLADEVIAKMHVKPPVHVIQNGIDVPMFDRDEGIDVHERFGLPKDKILVFFANRMEERKGIHIVRDMVFHCLRKYPHVAFAFAGRDLFGYMEKRILPFVRDNGFQDRFFYLGQLDLPAVRAVLKRTDIFLIPSLWENCPYSCIEAMTARKAIVASDCGGLPELIEDHRTGLLARSGDPASFIAALEEMIEDSDLRARTGEAARAVVESRLTDEAIARQSAELYRSWLDGRLARGESVEEATRASNAALRKEVQSLRSELSSLRHRLGEANVAAAVPADGAAAATDRGREPLLAIARSKAKAAYRRIRNARTRARLAALRAGRQRIVLSSTWAFPVATHTFVHQDMLGLIGAGWEGLVFHGERGSSDGLAARFRPLLRRSFVVETLDSVHEADLRGLDRKRPGGVDAFLARVGDATGRSVSDLRRDPIVRRAATFTRMAEIAEASCVMSWFCYEPSFHAMFASQVLGIPRVLSCHVDHVLEDHPLKLVPLHLATADLVLAISERTKAELAALGGDPSRILVKRNGVDGTRLRQMRGPRRGSFEILSLSRIEPKKGILDLVEAAAILARGGREFVLRIAGGVDPGHPASAECERALQRRVAELGLGPRVVLCGPVSNDAVPELLGRAHAFAAPYVQTGGGDRDGVPTSIAEAMGAGVPVVATDVGAVTEILEDGVEGFVVPQRDPARLAAAIERLMDDPDARRRLGDAGAARFDRELDASVTDVEFHSRLRALASGIGGGRP
ncbi:MAG: hypothetical protein Fur0037_10780 [Planctomycetota bacterium]